MVGIAWRAECLKSARVLERKEEYWEKTSEKKTRKDGKGDDALESHPSSELSPPTFFFFKIS